MEPRQPKIRARGAAGIALALTMLACGSRLNPPTASTATSAVLVGVNINDFLRSNGATFERRQALSTPTVSSDIAARKAEAEGGGSATAASEEYGFLTWAELRLDKRPVWLVTLQTQSHATVGYVFVDAADGRVLWTFRIGP
jgi:hypothetical protein